MSTSFMHRLTLHLVFPEGLSPGEGKDANLLTVSQDGNEQPVLRGTALAGALRHAWEKTFGTEERNATEWFGHPAEEDSRSLSPLRVPDVVLATGGQDLVLRTHNAINRHRGAVLEGSLFSLQSLPPGTSGEATLWLKGFPQKEEGEKFLRELVDIFDAGLTLGGKAARGLGRVELRTRPILRSYDRSTPEGTRDWLNDSHDLRSGRKPQGGEQIPVSSEQPAGVFSLALTLGIPGAEDLLIGDGQGLDHEMEPQKVKGADGKDYWRIPGSSLRGVFRAWFNRLAARAGYDISDSHAHFLQNPGAKGDELGWLGKNKEKRKDMIQELSDNPAALHQLIDCPVARLFGSSFTKSRIHISDALSPVGETRAQPRMHVAVDRFTGGATEGALFDNTVLTQGPQFTFHIRIDSPEEREVKWLLATVRALHHGVLRVGSSKAGGRLGVHKALAAGKESLYFTWNAQEAHT